MANTRVNIFEIIYYSIFLLALILSFFANPAEIPGLVFLRILLVIGLLNEGIVELLKIYGLEENFPHYFYLPLEYVLLILFYKKNSENKKLNKWLTSSILFYLIVALLLSRYYHHFKGYPTLLYNLGCLLQIIWLPMLLFNLRFDHAKYPMFEPVFILLGALFIFYAGVFIFNSTYKYMLANETQLAKRLRMLINVNLNYFIFTCMSIAFFKSRYPIKNTYA